MELLRLFTQLFRKTLEALHTHMTFHPAKFSLLSFKILSKILAAYCDIHIKVTSSNAPIYFLKKNPFKRRFEISLNSPIMFELFTIFWSYLFQNELCVVLLVDLRFEAKFSVIIVRLYWLTMWESFEIIFWTISVTAAIYITGTIDQIAGTEMAWLELSSIEFKALWYQIF